MAEFNNGLAYAKPNTPLDFNWDKAVEFGNVLCQSFEQEALFWYTWGPEFQFGNDHAFVQTHIKDPRQRLAELQTRAANYGRLVRSIGRDQHLRMFKPGYMSFGLYNSDNQLIGYSQFVCPKPLHGQIDAQFGRTSFKARVWQVWYTVKYWIADRFDFLWCKSHPQRNPRHDEYFAAVEASPGFEKACPTASPDIYQSYSTKTKQELQEVGYPTQDSVYLLLFMIIPEYQRKGLGAQFLNWSMEQVPRADAEFCHNGKIAYGPQKFTLQATIEGVPLYKKVGFVEHHYFESERGGKNCVNVCMDLTRRKD